MQSPKQIIWLSLPMIAGGIVAWLSIPPQRRNVLGLLIGFVAIVVTAVASGRRRAVHTEKYRNRYFVRCLAYDIMDGHVLVAHNKSPRVITLEPPLALIFGAADGQQTAQQFIEEVEAAYPRSGAPPGLASQTYRLLAKMEAEGLIRFTDQKTQLPYYLSMPRSQQDKERALVEMRRDGFIK